MKKSLNTFGTSIGVKRVRYLVKDLDNTGAPCGNG